MKIYSVVVVCILLSIPAFAERPSESDYTAQYEVVSTTKAGNWMAGNFCTMAVRDRSANGMLLIIQRKSHGDCHIPDSGTILKGRREKNQIAILEKNEKGGSKVEHWAIVGSAEGKP